MVRKPTEWIWSSASIHAGGNDIGELVDPTEWKELAIRLDWLKLNRMKEDEIANEQLMNHTRTGRPLGSEEFIDAIEDKLGYPVRRGSQGRPRSSSK